jgi:hypothetical protein
VAVGDRFGEYLKALEVEACAEILEGFKEGGEAGECEACFGEFFCFGDVVDLVFHDAALVVFHFFGGEWCALVFFGDRFEGFAVEVPAFG